MPDFDSSRWQILSPLFDEALDLDVDARVSWLQRLAETHPKDASDLVALLEDHAASARASFLNRPSAAEEDAAAGARALAGKVIGAYTMERIIGQGGTGTVWLAHRSDGRYQGRVAIKLLNIALIGRTSGARFQREGRILARLTHSHIAHLIDAGVTPDGQPYLALEYVEGLRIDRYCDEHRLDCAARIRLFFDVLDAVAHSHANLIVHRDIKPLNVLVDTHTNVKLLDFGIAKLLEDEASAETVALTRADVRLLTPDYAAPEQLLGRAVTTQTDIYSLGVVLYLLLSGVQPNAGRIVSKTGIDPAEVGREPPRMSTTVDLDENVGQLRSSTSEQLRRTLAGDLDNIVAKAMRVEPGERYATVAAFADDLRRFLEQRPVSAQPDTFTYRLSRFTSRHRGAVAAGVLSAAAILAGILGTLWQAHRAGAQAERAELERDRALKQLSYAEASDEFLSFVLQESGDKPISVSELLAHGEAILDRQFADDPVLRTHMLLVLANLYGERQEQNRAQALLRKAQAAASSVDDQELQAELDCTTAERLGDENEFDRAMVLFSHGIARLQSAAVADRAALADCLSSRAQVESLRNDHRAALADAQAAVAAYGDPPRPGQRMNALAARRAIAEAQGGLGNEALAITNLKGALDEMNRLGRGHNGTELEMLNSLGRHLSRSGQWLQAADIDKRNLDLAMEVEGADSVEPAALTNYAKLLAELGQPLEAQKAFTAALKSARERGHSRSLGPISLTAANAWCIEDDLERCRALLADARRELVASLPPGHSMLGSLETEEGRLAMRVGDIGSALDHFRAAERIFAKAPDFNPNRLRNESALARAEARAGALPEARKAAERAVADSRAALAGASESMFLGEALLSLGDVAVKQGDMATARSALTQASAQLLQTMGGKAPLYVEATRMLAALPS